MTPSEAPRHAAPAPDAATGTLRFSGDNTFHRELKRRIEADFRRRGRSPRDSGQMYLKSAVILAAFALVYVALVFFAHSAWLAVPLCIALGVVTAGIGFNIMHDGGHLAYSRHRGINRLSLLTLDMVGGSSYIWQWKHGRFHHTWVNVHGHDSDIDLGVLARLSPGQRRRPWHRWQHVYLWALYAVTVLRWHLYGDFRDLWTGTIGERPFPRPRGADLVTLVGGKLVFVTLAFVLPVLMHGWLAALAGYALVAAVAGLLLALVFQMAHVVEVAEFPEAPADAARLDTPWAIHQLRTTVNFATGNRLLSWMIGGLNFQVEHHLFPRISHVHYPAVSRVVSATCREFGVPYHVSPSFAASIASHYRWLRTMSLRPA